MQLVISSFVDLIFFFFYVRGGLEYLILVRPLGINLGMLTKFKNPT